MLRKVQCLKAIYCPKTMDFIFLEDCKKCEYFNGLKTVLTHTYVDCKYFDRYSQEGESDG